MKKAVILVLALLISNLFADESFYKYIWDTNQSIGISGNIIEISGDLVAIANDKNLYVYETTDIYNVRLKQGVTFDAEITSIEIVNSNYVAVTINSIMTTSSYIDTLDTIGRKVRIRAYYGSDVKQDGTMLYVSNSDSGVEIIDVGRNFNNAIVSNYHHAWGVYETEVKWPLLYGANKHGVVTVNLSNIDNPMPFGNNYDIFGCENIAKYNDFLFASSSRTLNVLDISVPGKMKLLDKEYFPDLIENIRVFGNELFVTLGDGGLEIYRITGNGDFRRANSFNDGSFIYDVAMSNDYLYILRKGKNVKIVLYK